MTSGLSLDPSLWLGSQDKASAAELWKPGSWCHSLLRWRPIELVGSWCFEVSGSIRGFYGRSRLQIYQGHQEHIDTTRPDRWWLLVAPCHRFHSYIHLAGKENFNKKVMGFQRSSCSWDRVPPTAKSELSAFTLNLPVSWGVWRIVASEIAVFKVLKAVWWHGSHSHGELHVSLCKGQAIIEKSLTNLW